WNEFGLALVLTNTPAAKTLPIGLYEFVGEFRVAWGPLTAAGMILLLPGLLVTYWAQRHFVRGLTFGAIKS
ncbi:MAG TPA: carbohydrate ABC transporter permease, partial [Chloroflexota bacterium]